MSYNVNPRAWGAVFPVPSDVVDKHIRLAGSTQLKVLLWLLRNVSQSPDSEEIAQGLRLDRDEVEDALKFWIDAGIVTSDGEASDKTNAVAENQIKKDHSPLRFSPKKELTYIKPNIAQILERVNEDDEIRFMFSEAQSILSKTIGHDGQSTLLMLHDSFGLPVEVILMLCRYCSSIGKSSFVYISKVGRDWGEKEIDTLEKADEEIIRLRSCNKVFSELRSLAGISTPQPTNAQIKYLECWTNELGFDVDMIYLAYEEMANNCAKISFPYMDKVLKNWHKDSLKTPDDVEKAKSSRKADTSANVSKSGKPKVSYDKDEYMRRALNDPLIYKKKEED